MILSIGAHRGQNHGMGTSQPRTTARRSHPLRTPIATIAVFAVTAVVNSVQVGDSGLLGSLERSPAGMQGQWWRAGTSLFVQDGGVFGAVSNLLFLLAIGVAAEQVVTRRRWLVHYFGAGVLSEFVGYAWQPTGGGNSIAVCGLAGALALRAGDPQLPVWAPQVVLTWCGVLAATAGSGSMATGIAVGVAAVIGVAVRGAAEKGLAFARLWGVAVAGTGLVLAVLRNVHGAALIIGIVLALATALTETVGGLQDHVSRGGLSRNV